MTTNLNNKSNIIIPTHGYINEIAKILGCTRQTVSNALHKNTKGILATKAREIYRKKYCNE